MRPILFFLIALMLVQGASADSNITINADKTISINGTKTFPTALFNICSYYHDDLEPCGTSISKNNNYTFSIKNFGTTTPSGQGAYYDTTVPIFEGTDVYFDVKAGAWNDANKNKYINSSRFFAYYQTPDELYNDADWLGNKADYEAIVAAGANRTHPVIEVDWRNMSRLTTTSDIPVFDVYTYRTTTEWALADYVYVKEHKLWNDFLRVGCSTCTGFDNISKPVWIVFEGYGYDWQEGSVPWKAFPDKKYVRVMVYWGITANARGVGFWHYKDYGNGTYPSGGLYANATKTAWFNEVMGEVKDLNEVLLLPNLNYTWGWYLNDSKVTFSNNPRKTVLNKGRPYLTYALKQNTTTGIYYLIVVNRDSNSVSTYINVTGLAGDHIWTTLGKELSGSSAAGRTLTSSNGNLTSAETFDGYGAHIYQISAAGDLPNITSWGNNKTINNTLAFDINTSEVVMFNATANQSVTTWNWYKDGVEQGNNFNSINLSWNNTGAKTISANATNSNGTSNTVSWTVTVNPPPNNPSKVGIGGASCQSPYCSTDHVTFDYGSGYARYGLVWDSYDDGDYGGTVMAGTFAGQNGALRQTTNGRIQYTLANYSNITMLLNLTDHISQTTDIMIMGDDSRANYNQAYILSLRTSNISRLLYRNSSLAWIIINDTNYTRTTTPQYIMFSHNGSGNITSYISLLSYIDALANGKNASGDDTHYTWGRNIVLQATNATYDDLWAYQHSRFEGNLTISYDAGSGNQVSYFILNLTGAHNATAEYRETDTGSYTAIGTYTAGSNNISVPGDKYRYTQVRVRLNGNISSSVNFESIEFFTEAAAGGGGGGGSVQIGSYTIGSEGVLWTGNSTTVNASVNQTNHLILTNTTVITTNDYGDGVYEANSVYTAIGDAGDNTDRELIQYFDTNSDVSASAITFEIVQVSNKGELEHIDMIIAEYSSETDTTEDAVLYRVDNFSDLTLGTKTVNIDPVTFTTGKTYGVRFLVDKNNDPTDYEGWDRTDSANDYIRIALDADSTSTKDVRQYAGAWFSRDNVTLVNFSQFNGYMNITTWHDAGADNFTEHIDINVSTPANTNYSVYYRQNGTGDFVQLAAAQSGNTSHTLSPTYQDSEVIIQAYSNQTKTPEVMKFTYFMATEGADFIPPTPINLQAATGNFWVKHTWQAGAGNITNSYNVSVNGTWHNGTTDNFWNNSDLLPHGWSNISVYAFNSSGGGAPSLTPAAMNSQLPNNPISISGIADEYSIAEGQWFNLTATATDADNDVPVFDDDTEKFQIGSSNGTVTWKTTDGDQGIYLISVNVTDNNGSVASKEFSLTVGDSTPSAVSAASITNTSYAAEGIGWLWVLFGWTATDNTDRYYIFINGTAMGSVTVPEYYSNNFTAHTQDINISILSHNSTLAANSSWANKTVDIPNTAPVIDIAGITDTNPDTGDMVSGYLWLNETEVLSWTADISDIDGDVITNSTNATSIFGGTLTAGSYSGTTNKTSAGLYDIDVSSCDEYGSCATNATIVINITDVTQIRRFIIIN